MKIDQELISEIRKTTSRLIAEELCSVQPMPSDTFERLYEAAKPEEELIAEGYEPVSRFGLMWIKKEPTSGSQ